MVTETNNKFEQRDINIRVLRNGFTIGSRFGGYVYKTEAELIAGVQDLLRLTREWDQSKRGKD